MLMIPDCFVSIANLLSSPGPASALCELLTLHLRPNTMHLPSERPLGASGALVFACSCSPLYRYIWTRYLRTGPANLFQWSFLICALVAVHVAAEAFLV